MNDIQLKIVNDGKTLAEGCGHLVYKAAYVPEDCIVLTVPVPGYYVIRLDDTINEEFVYMKETSFTLEIPFDAAHISYSPRAFAGEMHVLSVRPARPEEIDATRNLARNGYDCHGNTACYPHAWANVETRGEAVFAARNAIDGIICPESHGAYPYQSWGINRDPQACLMLDFGRPIKADTLILTTRADFPHDAWWESARLTLSNGETHTLTLEKAPDSHGQSFDLNGAVITSLMLDNLQKADAPSPFPALTQVEVWGKNL